MSLKQIKFINVLKLKTGDSGEWHDVTQTVTYM